MDLRLEKPTSALPSFLSTRIPPGGRQESPWARQVDEPSSSGWLDRWVERNRDRWGLGLEKDFGSRWTGIDLGTWAGQMSDLAGPKSRRVDGYRWMGG